MEISSDGNVIEAPDGSVATYDAKKTAAAYLEIDAEADCSCINCRNFRRAWKSEYVEPRLLAACARMGVDASKALEVTQVEHSGGLVTYHGQYPFFGQLTRSGRSGGYVPWSFTAEAYGSAQFTAGLASVEFFVEVPWVLEEPNPYAE
jgi:hypothetical protein